MNNSQIPSKHKSGNNLYNSKVFRKNRKFSSNKKIAKVSISGSSANESDSEST